MPGASGSGDDMETGRVNRAEGRTMLWAQVPPGQSNFNGSAIFVVEAADHAEDPSDYDEGENHFPDTLIHGIVSTGWSGDGPSQPGGFPGAAGVIGRGGANVGTGVVGHGGGFREPGGSGGIGGIGVHGRGGGGLGLGPSFIDPVTPPGAGVIGQGGRQDDQNNRDRRPHAAGVIGIGGGTGLGRDELVNHPPTDTGGVGVYGQGAELTVTMVLPLDATGNSTAGPEVESGPLVPKAGVLGRGGISNNRRVKPAAGVIGLAGGVTIPSPSETASAGVFGSGADGVVGIGGTGVLGRSDDVNGVGVFGVANDRSGRGAMLRSEHSAQLLLVPLPAYVPFPPPVTVTPSAIPGGKEGVELPRDGRGGDLLVLMDDQRNCVLWFCVRSNNGDADPAQWAQVLVGPTFAGTS